MGNEADNEIIAKPFLKWVGGKSQLITIIEKKFPNSISPKKPIKKYFEPFIGGGALFFHLMSHYNVENAYISDTNEDLILTYNVLKYDYQSLIKELDSLIEKWPDNQEDKRKEYERIRTKFNKAKKRIKYEKYSKGHVPQAARLIFLNKTCFNGIYRVNSKGEFNVPIGRYKNPSFYEKTNLENISHHLQKTEIFNKPYDFFEDCIDEESLVYLDPPYRPITETSFTSYTKSNFNDDDQKKLAEFYKRISEKKAKVILSNSDPHNRDEDDDFFDDLYKGFNVERVPAKRYGNRDGNNRGPINEILVRNYGY